MHWERVGIIGKENEGRKTPGRSELRGRERGNLGDQKRGCCRYKGQHEARHEAGVGEGDEGREVIEEGWEWV